jgi:hypothetical protein
LSYTAARFARQRAHLALRELAERKQHAREMFAR